MIEPHDKLLFRWHGIATDGTALSGWSVKRDHEELDHYLACDGITLIKASKRSLPKFRTAQAYRFLEQISSLLNAGIPILDALDLARPDKISRNSEAIFSGIIENLKSGLPLSSSIAPFMKNNDDIILQAITLGEKSGRFNEILDRLLLQRKKSMRVKSQLARAAIYPLVLIVVSTLVIVLMMVWAIPQFGAIYADFGAELPTYTLTVIAASEFLVTDGIALASWLSLIITCVLVMQRISPVCKKFLAYLQLHLPLIGYLLRIRFYRQFAADVNLIYRAGMPLGEALNWLPSTSSHPFYREVLKHVCENLGGGLSLNASLKSSGFFPPFFIQTIRVGENSGSLERAFERVEQFYDDALTNTTDKFTKLFEPLLVTILALIVGSLLVAMYLPIFNLGFVL